MRPILKLTLSILGLLIGLTGCAYFLPKKDESNYRIIITNPTDHIQQKAAAELQKYLFQMSGKTLPVSTTKSKKNIYLGKPENALTEIESVDLTAFESDGFYLKTLNDDLYIIGGNEKGVLYGVYELLEKMGCRQYSAEVQIIPEIAELKFPVLDEIQVPKIQYRDVLYHNAKFENYANWHKLDVPLQGESRKDWGYWCHSSFQLVDPMIYFTPHPEYFAEVNGKRIPSTQLCTTNQEVIKIVIERLGEEMAKKPEAQYWSVSQEDNYGYCTCEKCQAINDREGSPMGAILHMVNQVAEAFPDKIISTLAYEYSRRPPLHMKPRKNVNIMLCSIECNRSKPIAEDPSSAKFMKDVLAWDEISDNILVWDYVVQFKNLLSPFPNFHILQPNLRFFADHGGLAEFQQGNREIGGEFAELRAYLIAKLLWNPEANVKAIMTDFLMGYYGQGGKYIQEYIDLMTEALIASDTRLDIFGNPITAKNTYLAPELMQKYEALFDQAETAVAGNRAVLERVRICRLPLLYARLEQAKADPFGPGGWYKQENNNWIISDELIQMLKTFASRANKQGVTRVHEWDTTVDEYYTETMKFAEFDPTRNLAFQAKIEGSAPNAKYAHNGIADLTNGISGTGDWSMHWLGYEGRDLELILTLDKPEDLHELELSFIQDPLSWIFYPNKIEILTSNNGVDYNLFAKESIIPQKKVPKVGTFNLSGNSKSQYIKVKIEASKQCPEWHIGQGNPSWTFIDEVRVR